MGKSQSSDDEMDSMEGVDLGRLGNYLGFRMRRVHDIQSRVFQELTASFDLRQGMFSALEFIAANPGISQRQVGEEIGLDKSAMVPIVDELERRHWARRDRSTTDRRRYHLTITPAGQKILEKLFRSLDTAEAAGLAALTASELSTVRGALDKIYYAYRFPNSDTKATRKTAR